MNGDDDKGESFGRKQAKRLYNEKGYGVITKSST